MELKDLQYMVDCSDPVDSTMLLLSHLGQLRAIYGPEQFHKSRSHTQNGPQRVYIFSTIFVWSLWYWKFAWSGKLIFPYIRGGKYITNFMNCFGLIWSCSFVSGYIVYTYGWMRSKVKTISLPVPVNFHFQTNKIKKTLK